MNFKGFIGAAYQLDSQNVDCQQCVNLYPEMIESGNGKEGQIAYLRGTPGVRKVCDLPDPGQGVKNILIGADGKIYVFAYVDIFNGNPGYKLYRLTPNLSGGYTTQILGGTNSLSSAPVKSYSFSRIESVTHGDIPSQVTEDLEVVYIVYTYGSNAKYYRIIDSINLVEQNSVGVADEEPYWLYSTHIDYIDGYLIYCSPRDNRFYVGKWNSINASALDYASAEGNTDKINSLIALGRDLWVFNERSTEIYTNTGNADFPFERVQGGYIEKGCLAPYSPARIENTVFWLGRDEFGHGIIYAGSGVSFQRISTHAIEQAINTYSYDSRTKATGYTYSKAGHSFYVLNFEETTWVYDLSTKMWHERKSNFLGIQKRHNPDCCAFDPTSGYHLVGHYILNKVYVLDEDYFLDDLDSIQRIRTTPHITNEQKRMFCNSFQLDMEVGVGLESGQGSDPQVMMTFSKDNGHTWSSEAWASAGKKVGGVGEYRKRVIWRRLGHFRDLVLRVKITDPVKVRLIGAEIELQAGVS